MRSVLLRFTFLTLLITSNSFLFAQNDAIQKKLDSLKAKDDLGSWIIERLDYVSINPEQRFAYLMESQQLFWRKPKTYEEHYIFLDLLNNQGYYQLLDGNILGAIKSYEDAYAYYLKNKISGYEIVEYTLKPLSNNYTRIGDYERALYMQLLSVKFLIKIKDKPENIAAVYSNIAISYQSMGNLAAAEKHINAGLKLVGTNSQLNIILTNILAEVLVDQQAYLQAEKLIENNIQKQKKVTVTTAYWLMGSYTTAGKINKALNKLKRAENYLHKALGILDKYYNGTRLREKANILTHLGTIKLLEKDPLAAIDYFNQTLFTLKITDRNAKVNNHKIYGDNMLIDAFRERAEAYLQLKNPNEAYQNIKRALLSADKIRNEFGDDRTKERLQGNLKTIAEKGIEICFNLYQKIKDPSLLNEILTLAEQTKARTLLDQINRNQNLGSVNKKDSLFIRKQALERAIVYNEKQEIEGRTNKVSIATAALKYDLALVDKKIKQKYQQFNADYNSLPIDKVLAAMPNQKTIVYFFGSKAIYLIDIEKRKVNNVIKLNNAKSIKLAIKAYTNTYFQLGPNAMINAPKAFYAASNKIYQSILGGIELPKNEAVMIVPDDVLGYISFDGLITDQRYRPSISNWPFLIKNNHITYAFSLKTLVANKMESTGANFSGLFVTHQKNSNQPLKAVEDEAHAIEKTIEGDFLFNEEVTTSALNRAFEQSRVLHISTHAYLSGNNQEPTLDLDQEKLFLFELSAKKYSPSLVVLSACRTADGLLANGEGIISLSRGFNAIGTPATIAGLWNVNDVTAAKIISSFYLHLVNGKSSGEALHQAKIDWLNNPQNNSSLYLPYYWDNLILMGNDQVIPLSKATDWKLIIGITGGILILAILAWLTKIYLKPSTSLP
ncbi:CHAT domain-containing protein [Pedobacter insulae]|uniref:CHAT domain-containing protein n=1 Tax=Pedobacter insulae TaxID=414048 RepID=A0A1I2VV24_9SPHI|nr:CHAT domain-containing tetratricopeptide repeat protein [Pedobacter insulae]SFG92227.1 CHAT domain-containing protein [Pedobacter insulae]